MSEQTIDVQPRLFIPQRDARGRFSSNKPQPTEHKSADELATELKHKNDVALGLKDPSPMNISAARQKMQAEQKAELAKVRAEHFVQREPVSSPAPSDNSAPEAAQQAAITQHLQEIATPPVSEVKNERQDLADVFDTVFGEKKTGEYKDGQFVSADDNVQESPASVMGPRKLEPLTRERDLPEPTSIPQVPELPRRNLFTRAKTYLRRLATPRELPQPTSIPSDKEDKAA